MEHAPSDIADIDRDDLRNTQQAIAHQIDHSRIPKPRQCSLCDCADHIQSIHALGLPLDCRHDLGDCAGCFARLVELRDVLASTTSFRSVSSHAFSPNNTLYAIRVFSDTPVLINSAASRLIASALSCLIANSFMM